jgi:hypothetical protein
MGAHNRIPPDPANSRHRCTDTFAGGAFRNSPLQLDQEAPASEGHHLHTRRTLGLPPLFRSLQQSLLRRLAPGEHRHTITCAASDITLMGIQAESTHCFTAGPQAETHSRQPISGQSGSAIQPAAPGHRATAPSRGRRRAAHSGGEAPWRPQGIVRDDGVLCL